MSTSNETILAAQPRTEFGKGAARRVRRDHRIPAVVYGHGAEPMHITIPGHDTMMALKHRNAILTLEIDGSRHTTLAKHVQRDAVRGSIEHVDFILVSQDEKVEADVPVVTIGEGLGGTVVTVEMSTLTVSAKAADLPENIEVDIQGFTPGDHVTVAGLTLPAGVSVVADPAATVVTASESSASIAGDEPDGTAAAPSGAA